MIRVGGLELRFAATPGHTRDSYCYLVPADTMLLTGDTILGRGTTVVAGRTVTWSPTSSRSSGSRP